MNDGCIGARGTSRSFSDVSVRIISQADARRSQANFVDGDQISKFFATSLLGLIGSSQMRRPSGC